MLERNNTAAEQYVEIDLHSLFSAIWEHALSVILVAIIGGVIALAYCYFMVTPQYKATTTMYVNTTDISLGSTSVSLTTGDLSTADKMVDIYITILGSRETLKEVASQAGIEYDYERLSKMITAVAGRGSGVFVVTVESDNPTEAELLANTVAAVLPDRISDIVDGTSTRVIEYAVVPSRFSSPSYLKSTVLGILAGAVLTCMVICIVDITRANNDTLIHSPDELRALYPDIPVLAVVADMRITKKSDNVYADYYGREPEKKDKKSPEKKKTGEYKKNVRKEGEEIA